MIKIKRFILVLVVVGILSLFQFYFSSWFSIFGIRPNFILAGLTALIASISLVPVLAGGLLAGLLTIWTSWQFNWTCLSFLIAVLIAYFLVKQIIFDKNIISFFILGTVSTIIFNFLYTTFGWSTFSILWHYFFSLGHLIEIILNGIFTIIFGWLFKKINI